MRCIFLAAGSSTVQNACPAYVVGSSEPMSTSEESRGARPRARLTPAAAWAAPLRAGDPPLIGRVENGRLLLDPRTLTAAEIVEARQLLLDRFGG